MMRSLSKKFGRAAALVAIVGIGVLGVPSIVSAAGPLDGLTIPAADPSLAFVAPTPDQPNYDARVQAFVQATVPDTWNGQPVQFQTTLNDIGVDQLGLPTSEPTADPHNPQFVYQRFQNGLLFYNAAAGTTTELPLS
ncbi:MAG: hypothetical protein JO057_30735 [Chloroflexi bacterium]|nr:hypothetical protein [Chloroflexota bacterium]